jgi:hypothetical protein
MSGADATHLIVTTLFGTARVERPFTELLRFPRLIVTEVVPEEMPLLLPPPPPPQVIAISEKRMINMEQQRFMPECLSNSSYNIVYPISKKGLIIIIYEFKNSQSKRAFPINRFIRQATLTYYFIGLINNCDKHHGNS